MCVFFFSTLVYIHAETWLIWKKLDVGAEWVCTYVRTYIDVVAAGDVYGNGDRAVR